MKLHMLAWILVMIGGLNWLLIGLFNWGVGNILGASITRIIYIVVGLATLYEIFTHKKNCKNCSMKGGSMPMNGGMGTQM